MKNCEICNKHDSSKSKPAIPVPCAKDVNSVISIDLKEMGKDNILWMICSLTKLIKGVNTK